MPINHLRLTLNAALAAFALTSAASVDSFAQDRDFWEQKDTYGEQRRPATTSRGTARRDDAYRPPGESYDGPPGGFGRQAGPDGLPPGERGYSAPTYGAPPYGAAPNYGAPAYNPPPSGQGQYGSNSPSYDPRYDQPPPALGPQRQAETWRDGGPGYARGNDVYRPDNAPAHQDNRGWGNAQPGGYQQGAQPGYGQPYTPPGQQPGYGQGYGQDSYQQGDRYGDNGQRRFEEPRQGGTFSQNEVVDTGHRFFGSISTGLARAVERVFRSQGRPNGYILGEDAGGAFVAGLRYGEGTLYTKDVGNHRVYWQGPSLGYDFGGEGSKTMVLVYNLRDPADMYTRFAGVQGAAYVIGGISVQFQAHEHVTLAVIRSGVGLRLGANVGYLKYTRTPTWNPF